jgi:selenophosphate synthetase-related protein
LRCNHIEAVVEHCKETGLEIEVASTLISQALKAKIREDAQENNMMRKTAKLPI